MESRQKDSRSEVKACKHYTLQYIPPDYDKVECFNCKSIFPLKDKNGNWIDWKRRARMTIQ